MEVISVQALGIETRLASGKRFSSTILILDRLQLNVQSSLEILPITYSKQILIILTDFKQPSLSQAKVARGDEEACLCANRKSKGTPQEDGLILFITDPGWVNCFLDTFGHFFGKLFGKFILGNNRKAKGAAKKDQGWVRLTLTRNKTNITWIPCYLLFETFADQDNLYWGSSMLLSCHMLRENLNKKLYF